MLRPDPRPPDPLRPDPRPPFWRLSTGAEIDYVEEGAGQLYAYEFKYGKKKARMPKSWQENYGENFSLINKDNFLDFVLDLEKSPNAEC